MATYFYESNCSEIQPDHGLQTLYLMNPPFTDTTNSVPQNPNMFLFNPNSLNTSTASHAPPSNSNPHHLIGFPMVSENQSRPSFVVPSHHVHRYDQDLDQADGGGDVGIQLGFRRPLASSMRQGLSLSLSATGERNGHHHHDISMSGNSVSPAAAVSSGGVSGGEGLVVVMGSKYLRVVQELLDEVVNLKITSTEKEKDNESPEAVAGEGSGCGGGGGDSKHGEVELSTSQRQELQTKKAKLITMLDEVEQRYKQYHHQMQVALSSFEQVAGLGAAKSYTSLALHTISKQFRCLKDAIMAQIKTTSKALGKEDCLGAKGEGSRLRFVDHQLHQQRTLQQLGMIQNNAWRPQRGLPKRAVSVLRAWLFEHFLHPYPKDSDKIILAKQTGLTRSQVSNWFINARVRLWKPMVEEMYLEETKEKELENRNKTKTEKPSDHIEQQQMEALQSKPETSSSTIQQIVSPSTTDQYHHRRHQFSSNSLLMSTSGGVNSLEQQTTFNLIGSPSSGEDSRGIIAASKFNDRFSLNNGNESFGAYNTMGDQYMPRFAGNSSVSLSLDMELGRAVEPEFCGINNNPTTQPSHWL